MEAGQGCYRVLVAGVTGVVAGGGSWVPGAQKAWPLGRALMETELREAGAEGLSHFFLFPGRPRLRWAVRTQG